MTNPKKGRNKVKFFGFPISRSSAPILFILGVLIFIGTLTSFLWMGWSLLSLTALGFQISGYGIMTILPWLIMEISILTLSIYMIIIGKKGK